MTYTTKNKKQDIDGKRERGGEKEGRDMRGNGTVRWSPYRKYALSESQTKLDSLLSA